MPEPIVQPEQELAAQPALAVPAAPGAAPLGTAFSPSMASAVRAFHAGRPGVPPGFGPAQVTALQRTAGNQAVARLVRPSAVVVARQHPPPAPVAPPVAAPPAAGPPGPTAVTPAAPTAANPGSGVDWDAFWTGETPNMIRSFLEVARLYPGWGLLAGGAADLMNAKQDFAAIQGEDAPEIEAFMAGRHAVAILNNGVGHVIYVVELVQDIATASVVGAEVDAITIPLNELLLGIKVGLDGVQFVTDFGLTCAAQYRVTKAPPGPAGDASRKAWNGMVANYKANLVGDLVGGIFDIIDLSSAGFSNAQPVKQGAKAVKATFDVAKLVKGLVKSVLQGWFGVWGGKAFEPGAAEKLAGGVILGELQRMKLCYTVGDAIIGAAADHIAKQLTELNAAATMALGGRDPFITARDAAVEGLGQLEERVGELGQMQAMATTAAEKTAAIQAWADEQIANIAALAVPSITIPRAEVGDDAVSDLAESALNLAGGIAGAGLQLLVDELNEEVDELKGTLTPPVETIKGHATDLGAFMQIVTDEAREQITATQETVADVRGKLQKCNSFEDVVNMIIQQIFDMVGLESDFKVDDIRQLWVDVGAMIDEGIVWAEGLRDGKPVEAPRAAAGEQAGADAGAGGVRPGDDDPTAGRAGPGAAAAPAAAASPPSAPPSGATAGRDLERPAPEPARAGTAGGAGGGGGAPALDPAAFTGGASSAAAAAPAGHQDPLHAGRAGGGEAEADGTGAGTAGGSAASAGTPVGAGVGGADPEHRRRSEN